MIIEGWEYRRHDENDWSACGPAAVWESLGRPKDDPGPYHYRTRIEVHQPAVLRFGAVSYACEVLVDGRPVGRHEGLWTPFEVPLADELTGVHDLELVIEKPASLTAGPDSAHRAGRFPTREVPSGFLPYVWGHLPGGPWQPVELLEGDAARLSVAVSHGDDCVRLQLLRGGPEASWTLTDPDGELVGSGVLTDGVDIVAPEGAARWSPSHPALYSVEVRAGTARWRAPVAFRTPGASGSTLTLNGEPFQPRLALTWGWYPDRLDPAASDARIEHDLSALRSLGFNGVKLCLWFPPERYLAVADRLGMAVWLELPMWLPSPTPAFVERFRAQTHEILDVALRHPCVVLHTLGCELNASVGTDVLAAMFHDVKRRVGSALVCDNSGSGEAYGGAEVQFAEFADHHLYAELEHLGSVLERFAPGWRGGRPWLLGEFCDYDTLRPEPPDGTWFASADPAVNPQGARWDHTLPWLAENVRTAGLGDRWEELRRASIEQGTFHRKVTLETVRLRGDVAGYVVTGERDTPISSAGVLDDSDALKYEPARWRSFQADTVLLLDPPRRRQWRAGGDRPAYLDPWCHWGGGRVVAWLLASCGGPRSGPRHARWRLIDASGTTLASGVCTTDRATAAGTYPLGLIEVPLPEVVQPSRCVLHAEADGVENSWTLWVYPRPDLSGVRIHDPRGVLAGIEAFGAGAPAEAGTAGPVIATAWTPGLDAMARRGATVVLTAGPGEQPWDTDLVPFWRENVKAFGDSPVWRQFPHQGWAGSQFLGIGGERAFRALPPGAVPVLSRLDTRTGRRHEYLWELQLGAGRLRATTLEPAGGRGTQPTGIVRNVAGVALLAALAGGEGGQGHGHDLATNAAGPRRPRRKAGRDG